MNRLLGSLINGGCSNFFSWCFGSWGGLGSLDFSSQCLLNNGLEDADTWFIWAGTGWYGAGLINRITIWNAMKDLPIPDQF